MPDLSSRFSDDNTESSNNNPSIDSQYQRQSTVDRFGEDEMRSITRSSIRKQVEIEIYIPCSPRLRRVLEMSFISSEATLHRKISSVSNQSQTFFGITSNHQSPSDWGSIVSAMRELRSKTLPHDRLHALLLVAKQIPFLFLQEHVGVDKPFGADEFLPIFIYILVKSQLQHIFALNEELQGLCDPDNRMSETGYYLATFEASIQHLMEYDEEHCRFAFFLNNPSINRSSMSGPGDYDSITCEESESRHSNENEFYRAAFLESPPPFSDSFS